MREEVLVENPHGNDMEFGGELLINESHFDVGFVKVWRTRGGSYVLRQTRSSRPGFKDIDRADKFNTAQKLSETLGHSRGAKVISRKLGLSRTDRID